MSIPYLPLIAPTPLITGYIGYFAGMMALLIIPLIFLVRYASRWVWGYRSNPTIRRSLMGTWLVCAVVFVATLSFTARNFDAYNSDTSTVHSSLLEKGKPLSLHIDGVAFNDRHVRRISFGNSFLANRKFYNTESINIRLLPTEAETMSIRKIGESRGSSPRNARRNIDLAEHQFTVVGNSININDYYTINRKGKYRGQDLQFEILIPIGTTIDISGNAFALARQDFEDHGDWEEDLWTMTEKGLIKSIEQKI